MKALAHVTGGGIARQPTRVLPDGVGVELDWGSWERPPVFGWLAEQGVEEEELRRVFNVGIGYVRGRPGGDAGRRPVIGRIDVIGVLVSGEGTNLQALIDAGLPDRRRRVEQAGGARARARRAAGIATATFPPRVRRPRGARRRDGRLARGARSRPRRLCRVHAPAAADLPRPLAGRVVNTHPRRCPSSPARGRSRTCSRPACPRPRRPCTSSTRASTAAR